MPFGKFGKWSDPAVPHKGWQHQYVYDLFSEGSSGSETLAVCEMCEKESIRYVHVVSHIDYDFPLSVGCICASKMTEDYQTPKLAERNLKNRHVRRERWIHSGWKTSHKGNLYRRVDGRPVTIFSADAGYKFIVGNAFSRQAFPTRVDAKRQAFDQLFGTE